MTWSSILGHQEIVARFARAAQRNRVSGSYLFVGANGIGKRTFATELARTLLCHSRDDNSFNSDSSNVNDSFNACGACASCQLFGTSAKEIGAKEVGKEIITHPDFFFVCKPPEKTAVPLELLVGEKEERGRSGLCGALSHTASMGKMKVAILDDADTLHEESANALLKTLEEPPPKTMIILLGTSAAKQLPTIRSRCRIVRFSPIPTNDLATLIFSQGIIESQNAAEKLAARAQGSMTRALSLNDSLWEKEQQEVLEKFSAREFSSVSLTARMLEMMERANKESTGKEAAAKRQRLRTFLEIICEREVTILCRPELLQNTKSSQNTTRESATFHLERLERTLEAITQIDHMATPAYVLEAWSAAISLS